MGRDPPNGARRLYSGISRGLIIMVALWPLGRLTGSHATTETIEQQSAEEVGVREVTSLLARNTVVAKLCLHCVPDFGGYDAGVFATEALILMTDLANINRVEEQVADPTARPSYTATVPAIACLGDLGPKPLAVQSFGRSDY